MAIGTGAETWEASVLGGREIVSGEEAEVLSIGAGAGIILAVGTRLVFGLAVRSEGCMLDWSRPMWDWASRAAAAADAAIAAPGPEALSSVIAPRRACSSVSASQLKKKNAYVSGKQCNN